MSTESHLTVIKLESKRPVYDCQSRPTIKVIQSIGKYVVISYLQPTGHVSWRTFMCLLVCVHNSSKER